MKFKHLTKKNIEWLFDEAAGIQGCLPPDECESNRDLIEDMRAEFDAAMQLVKAGDKRDEKAIKLFLKERGLQEIPPRSGSG